MIHRFRHIPLAFTRFLALALIVLFSTIRIAALLHTHDYGDTSKHRIKLAHSVNFSHSPSATSDTHDASEEDCALCDLLLHSHGEAASGLVFAILLLPFVSCTAVIMPQWNKHHSAIILADRAPPAFPVLH